MTIHKHLTGSSDNLNKIPAKNPFLVLTSSKQIQIPSNKSQIN